MPNPTDYNPSFSFAGFQTHAPDDPLPGAEVDSELEAVGAVFNDHKLAIMDVRRADGKLKNGIVTTDSLADGVKASLGVGGVTYPFRANARVVAPGNAALTGRPDSHDQWRRRRVHHPGARKPDLSARRPRAER
jgi:hypothetical protein